MRPTSVLATVTGRDRPGVTSAFFAALAAHDVDVRDVEQVVIRNRLVLSVLFDLRGDPSALRSSAMTTARALGMECEVTVADEGGSAYPAPLGSRVHVLALGTPLRPGAVSHVAQRIADLDDNIEAMTQLGSDAVTALELVVRSGDVRRLRAALTSAAQETGIDLAVERADVQRRAKRLAILDLDVGLLAADPLRLLADRLGRGDESATSAERARTGELDVGEALHARVGLLAGLTDDDVTSVAADVEAAEGARSVVQALHQLGYRVGGITTAPARMADRLREVLELDHVTGQQLESTDGRLTGRLCGTVLDGSARARALDQFAAAHGIPLEQCVAVGDGVQDAELLAAAGLGIAAHSRSVLVTVPFVLGVPSGE